MSRFGHHVSVRSVRMGYGAAPDVLCGLSLEVGIGEVVALLGRNGVGKTTLVRLIAGLRKPRSGGISVGDWDVTARRPDEMARRVGYAFQHADQQLFARTVREDVGFGPRMLGIPRGDAAVQEVLDELGLTEAADVHPYDLPAPVRKLVTLAGVLAMAPGVLLLDEPTAGMDLSLRDVVTAAIRRRAAAGTTVVAVSHDLSFVAELAGRVVVMRDGVVALDAEARDLLSDTAALARLGYRAPPAAAVGIALEFGGRPVRREEIVARLRTVKWK